MEEKLESITYITELKKYYDGFSRLDDLLLNPALDLYTPLIVIVDVNPAFKGVLVIIKLQYQFYLSIM
jgi:hypothetical protein